MDRILRFAAVAALGLAFVVAAPAAKAQDGVTVGGWIEVIGGSADNDDSVNGISRGWFSRIAVNYDDTLNNGLVVSGRAAFQLNQRGDGVNVSDGARMDAATNYAPDVLYVSVGGGFGTLTVGAAAPASCSVLPRPIAFVNGVNGTHYRLFSKLDDYNINETFSEFAYCGTPEQISYSTPTVNGFRAMLTWAPDNESNQGTSLKNARGARAGDNVKDRMDLAASWSTSMGAANVSVGVGYQQGRYQQVRTLRKYEPLDETGSNAETTVSVSTSTDMSSTAISATVGLGALTLGASWYDTDEAQSEHDGYTLAAKYDIGNLTLGTTYSVSEGQVKNGTQEDSALVVGASYAVGGGLTTWIEYMTLETDCTPNCGYDREDGGTEKSQNLTAESDDIILVGVTLGF